MKIVFNYSGVRNSVYPQIDDALANINEAINISSAISVPSNFTYALFLRNIRSDLSRHQRTLNNLKSSIDRTHSRLITTSDNIDSSIRRIKGFSLQKRSISINKV